MLSGVTKTTIASADSNALPTALAQFSPGCKSHSSNQTTKPKSTKPWAMFRANGRSDMEWLKKIFMGVSLIGREETAVMIDRRCGASYATKGVVGSTFS